MISKQTSVRTSPTRGECLEKGQTYTLDRYTVLNVAESKQVIYTHEVEEGEGGTEQGDTTALPQRLFTKNQSVEPLSETAAGGRFQKL